MASTKFYDHRTVVEASWLNDVNDAVYGMTPVFSASTYGADPNGGINSTVAFQKLSAAVQAAGGGRVVFKPGTYLLGQQTFAGGSNKGYAYQAATMFKLSNATKQVSIDATGATFRFAPGLRYGAFNPVTGESTGGTASNTDNNTRADAGIMFLFEGCTGGVTFEGGHFDGSQNDCILGGVWGDVGRQTFGTAIYVGNGYTTEQTYCGNVKLSNLTIKDMPQDGLYLASDKNPMLLENVTIDRCGRNNISWTGGKLLTMINVVSTNAGQGVISTAPASCMDIEDEVSGTAYNLVAINSKFVGGAGYSIVSLPAGQAQQTYESCIFGGNFNNNTPRVRLMNCINIGPINQPNFAAPDWTRGLTATNCVFTTKGAAYGESYNAPTDSILLAISNFNRACTFYNCRFEAIDGHVGDMDTNSQFHNCYFTQSGTLPVQVSNFGGTFFGKNYAYIGNGKWTFSFNIYTSCVVFGELAFAFDSPGVLDNWNYNGVQAGVNNYAPQAMSGSNHRWLTVNDPANANITVQTSSTTVGSKVNLNDGYDGVTLRSVPQLFGSTTGFSVDIAGAEKLHISPEGHGSGGTDNTQTWGTAAKRWSTLFAGTGTISTSDERDKQDIRELSEAEQLVAMELKKLLRAFKYRDAVDLKGDGARWHVGVIAQQVKEAFEKYDLVAEEYGVLCYDEWVGGDRYGVRYDELMTFIISAL